MVRNPHLEYGERVIQLRVKFDAARLAAIGLMDTELADIDAV